MATALGSEMQNMSSKIDEWCNFHEQALDKLSLNHEQEMNSAKGTIESLQNKKGELGVTLRKIAEETRLHKVEEAKVLQEIETLQNCASSLPQQIKAVKQSELEGLTRAEEIKAEIVKLKQTKENETKELTKGIVFYKRLGLDFKRVGDDRLRLIFTQIDAAFPEKEFSFTIKVDQTDAYQVEACEPAIPEIPEYLACLNKSNDFSVFVRTMRQSFKKSVTAFVE
jgi:hypothetical protein